MSNTLLRDAHVLGWALSHPWALHPAMLTELAVILSRHAAGHDVDDAVLAGALVKRRADLPQARGGGVAVIPVFGVIAPRMTMLSEVSGGTSYDTLSKALAVAMANPAVQTIVLDMDTPGGSVAGCPEFAAELRAARQIKPIHAVANYLMASAGYWLASSTTKIYAPLSAQIGSVGVMTLHTEMSKALATVGITKTYVSAGKHKVEINDVTPLTEETLARLQAQVDQFYGLFVADIAVGRDVTAGSVRSGYGEGRMLSATDALAAGMIDGIATIDTVIARAMKGAGEVIHLDASLPDTLQEPSPATSQDQHATQRQQHELALLTL